MYTDNSNAATYGRFERFFAAFSQAFAKMKAPWHFAWYRPAAAHPRSGDTRMGWKQPGGDDRRGGSDFYPEPDDARNNRAPGDGGWDRMSYLPGGCYAHSHPPTDFEFPYPARGGGDGFAPRMAPAAQFRMEREAENMGYMAAMFAKFAQWFGFRSYSPGWSMQPTARSRDPAFYHRA